MGEKIGELEILIEEEEDKVRMEGARDIWAVLAFGRNSFHIASNDMKTFIRKSILNQSNK
jgi:hypothetical protein